MCGIVGFIEKKHNLYAPDLKVFETMLLVDSLRGEDSTGAFSVYGKSGSINYIKQATNPLNLFRTPEWDKFKQKSVQSAAILVGHNRKATVGEVKTANAHPFLEGNTILIHNGGITNWRKFDSTKTVDSHAVCAAIDKEGHQAILPELEGAYTLVWYNIKDKMLYFARNEERPLCFMDTDSYQMWASEELFMRFALLKNGMKPGKSWELATHTVAGYSLDKKCWFNTEYKPKKTFGNGNYTHTNVASTNQITAGTPWDQGDPMFLPPVNIKTNPITKAITTTTQPINPMLPGMQQKSPKILDCVIQKDMVVFFEVEEHRSDTTNGRVKIYGKCLSPDLEHCDIVHLMATADLRVAEKLHPRGSIVQGTVTTVSDSVCGLSAWVKEVQNPTAVAKDFSGIEWPVNILSYLLLTKKHSCDYCSNDRLILDDFKWSRVAHEVEKGLNRYTVECPECVYTTLDGEKKDAFEKDYPHTLHNSKQIIKAAAI